jgi:hypothetical protein
MSPALVSMFSRRCLEAIRLDEHVAVFSSKLRQEWRKHASLLAKQWQVAMQQRRRIEEAEGAEYARLLDPACDCLSGLAKKEALRKDFHLVQSALATGQILLSNETRLPSHLKSSCKSIPEFRRIFFANPEKEKEECIDWIRAGAKKEPQRRVDRFSNS